MFNKQRTCFIITNEFLRKIVISISRNGLLKSCARIGIEPSKIRKKQNAFKSVHFECRMVLFTRYGRKVEFFSMERWKCNAFDFLIVLFPKKKFCLIFQYLNITGHCILLSTPWGEKYFVKAKYYSEMHRIILRQKWPYRIF